MRSRYPLLLSLLFALLIPAPLLAEDQPLRIDGGLVFSHFEQQVKTEIGGERGEKLVTDTELGLQFMATWTLWTYLDVGLYTQLDRGSRESARFTGFDSQNRAQVVDQTGGAFTEFWIGPLIRGTWRGLFAEFAYGAFGQRWDDAREDLATASGDTETALSTSASVAWYIAIGASLPLVDTLDAVLRIEYRVRYYDSRGGEKLADETVHGTQNLTPFFGIAWRPRLFAD